MLGATLLSVDNLSKQFGPRSGPTFCRAWSGSKLFDTLMLLKKKSSIQRVKYGTIIKCEGIIKAMFENPKASTVILLPSADSFKKGCCQLQAKVCARITG